MSNESLSSSSFSAIFSSCGEASGILNLKLECCSEKFFLAAEKGETFNSLLAEVTLCLTFKIETGVIVTSLAAAPAVLLLIIY